MRQVLGKYDCMLNRVNGGERFYNQPQGMRTIGPFVAERFLEIVKCRNRLAKSLGYIDYYDFKVMAFNQSLELCESILVYGGTECPSLTGNNS